MDIVKYRPYRAEDFNELSLLLTGLKNFYPGFDEWLTRKLNEPETFCYIAFIDKAIIGVVIGAPKSAKKYKISTLFVHPDFRNIKVGTTLIKLVQDHALSTDSIEELFITSDKSLLPTLGEWLQLNHHFVPLYAVPNKYFEGNTEIFYYKTTN